MTTIFGKPIRSLVSEARSTYPKAPLLSNSLLFGKHEISAQPFASSSPAPEPEISVAGFAGKMEGSPINAPTRG